MQEQKTSILRDVTYDAGTVFFDLYCICSVQARRTYLTVSSIQFTVTYRATLTL